MTESTLRNPNRICLSETAITTTINQNKAQLKCLSTKKIWLIAAVIALTLLLVGCAIIYARWSSGLEDWFRPSNTIRQQAEQSGLSVIYPQDQIQEDGLSATDQGITVSVKQTIVDQWRASIVLKIEGFELPDGVRPCFYGERPTLDGNAEFCGSAGYHFYDGIVINESGESVYKNGEPVKEEHYPMEEFSDYSYVVGRYYLPDGSMELTLSYNFIDSSGANLGKDIKSFFYRIWQGNRPWESNDRDRTVGFWKLETLYSTKWNRTGY